MGNETAVEFIGGFLGKEDCGVIAVVIKMARCYQTIAALNWSVIAV